MNLENLFAIKIIDKRMRAEIYCTEAYKEFKKEFTEKQLKDFLAVNQVIYGISKEAVTEIVDNAHHSKFPFTIATGLQPEDGTDGFIAYTFEENMNSDDHKEFNFRDVMHIPSVQQNDEIAVETLPTKGNAGTNISGITIQPTPGKRKIMRAGKNVYYNEEIHTYFAAEEGQVSIRANRIDVHELFTVPETLSMKTGNVNFVGSVEIHGDVPTGYTIEAGGDIRVFGLVEAASLNASGSVFIEEGFAAMQKGTITAAGDIHVSYINQGYVQAGQSIYVENSILHSTCNAEESVICKRGNITGGSTIAGYLIEARDIGNRVHTQTKVKITEEDNLYKEEDKLMEELYDVQTTIDQLELIGNKLQENANLNESKMRITLLRQKSSMQKMMKEKEEIQQKIDNVRANYFRDGEAKIIARQELFGNVTIKFGKYEQTIQRDYTFAQCQFHDNELSITQLV